MCYLKMFNNSNLEFLVESVKLTDFVVMSSQVSKVMMKAKK